MHPPQRSLLLLQGLRPTLRLPLPRSSHFQPQNPHRLGRLVPRQLQHFRGALQKKPGAEPPRPLKKYLTGPLLPQVLHHKLASQKQDCRPRRRQKDNSGSKGRPHPTGRPAPRRQFDGGIITKGYDQVDPLLSRGSAGWPTGGLYQPGTVLRQTVALGKTGKKSQLRP